MVDRSPRDVIAAALHQPSCEQERSGWCSGATDADYTAAEDVLAGLDAAGMAVVHRMNSDGR